MSHQLWETSIAASAGGCFTRSDAIAAGLSPADVRRLIRSGAWVQLRRGAFAERVVVERAHSPELRHRLEAAAVVRTLAGPVVLSGRTAALLHGLPLQPNGLVHVTRQPGSPGRWRTAGVDVHEAALPDDHITDVDGFRATSATRTVVDLARAVAFRDAVTAADFALHQGLTHKRELQAVVDFCRSWPRIRPAQHVITLPIMPRNRPANPSRAWCCTRAACPHPRRR